MITGIFDNGSIQVLERMVSFTEARQEVLSHNIANLSTPYFEPVDLNPKVFQKALGNAIDRRRSGENPTAGKLRIDNTRQIRFNEDGTFERINPGKRHDNIMFHDRNDRDLERIMQDLAENTMAHRSATELLRSRYNMIETAIRERL